jgi:hypothetical protein
MHTQDIILIFTHQNSKGTTNKLLFHLENKTPFVFRCVRVCPQVLNLSKLTVYYCMKSFFFIAFFIQQKIYPKHVLPFVGIVLAETQQRRDIAMLIT